MLSKFVILVDVVVSVPVDNAPESAKDNVPLPFVVRTCPFVQSEVG